MEDSINIKGICSPILDINSVLEWKCNKNCWVDEHGVNKLCNKTQFLNSGYMLDLRDKNTAFPEYKLPQSVLPKTIFCHDFKGGYLEDKFCNGSANISTYHFLNWSVIDIFIYFSHKLVTIPPKGWIDAGHKHGVPVLGTLITEWDDGEKIWNDVLSDAAKTNLFSLKLAEICAHFEFDGYLLNVENKLSKDLVPRLINFVSLLKSNLDLCCKRKTWLLWYDSVTIEGKLEWQNQLCALNKPFFDKCDGIFLNYVWTPGGLIDSLREAGDRRLDVYVGVDVWGRNCYYDGGFNLDKALGVVRGLNMSVAIFAPGWTFEAAPQDQFTQRELAFWRKISPYLYAHGPTDLPFDTNFCQGILYDNNSTLFNLSAQQFQPTSLPCSAESSCISPCFADDTLAKKPCLRIKSRCQEHSKLFHRVFVCDFSGNGRHLEIRLLLQNSPTDGAKKFQIFFITEDKLSIEGKQAINMKILPRGYRTSTDVNDLKVVASLMDFAKEEQKDGPVIESQTHPQIDSHDCWHPVTFVLKMAPNTSLTEVLVVPPPVGSILWGGLHIAII